MAMIPTDLESLRRRIADIAGVEPSEITDDDALMDLGLDSLRVMVLLGEWRSLGLEFDTSAFLERPTLVEWMELIRTAGRREA